MKKIVLTAIVVAVFIAYSYMFRHNNSKLVLKPSNATTTTTSKASTPSSTSGSNTSTTSTPTQSTTSATTFHDGTYTGSVNSAFYGNVEVAATIRGGKITDVRFLQSPNDNPNSININQQAIPLLVQEALHAQSANVDVISGATDTSQAFFQSLSNALSQAQ